jgi:hypothetical protein
MSTQTATNFITSGLLAVLIAMVIALIKLGTAWIESKTSQIQNTKVRDAFLHVEAAVESAVNQTAQQEADSLKAAAQDGKLSEEEKQKLKQIAIDRAMAFVSLDAVELVKDNIQDFTAWIDALVEKYVRQSK